MRKNSDYMVKSGVFIKFVNTEAFEIFCKSRALYELSTLTKKFISPKVKDYSATKQSIEYEYIEGAVSCRNIYLDYVQSRKSSDMYLPLFRKIGTTLGVIHKNLNLESKFIWDPATHISADFLSDCQVDWRSIAQSSPHAYLHCDFGFSNIYFTANREESDVIIFDPCPNGFVTFHVNTYGSIYIDLANFVSCLEGLVPLINYPKIHWESIRNLKNAFILGYESETGFIVDRDFLDLFSYFTVTRYFNHRFSRSIISNIARSIIYNSFKNNLPRYLNNDQ